ncbi:lipoprotein [[Acholeplasma] multilocale]|uniref:lipoprotein n=1 Tax=[Acholeplasma] multilocale TaxID=264638 RepID=UPI00041D2CF7|nr:lipoprotein [[Acholeplasma] multilocale]
MKKILSLLGAIGLTAAACSAVVACSDTKEEKEETRMDVGDLIRGSNVSGMLINYLSEIQDQNINGMIAGAGYQYIEKVITDKSETNIEHIMGVLGEEVPDYFSDLTIQEYWGAAATGGMIIKGEENNKVGIAANVGKIPFIMYALFESKRKVTTIVDEKPVDSFVNLFTTDQIEVDFVLNYIPAALANVDEVDSVITIKSITVKAKSDSDIMKGSLIINLS